MNISTYTLAAFAGILLTLASCQSTKKTEDAKIATTDTTAVATDTALVATIQANPDYRLQDSISVLFIVSNPTPDTLRFTQYHTPFEGFMSNFLTITDASGAEVPYIGAMTRRIMPPPEETYHTLAPRAQDSVRFALSKGYHFEKPGTYSLLYNSGTISGISQTEATEIVLK
ncbi:hypothetical protein [Sphingobacterium deserti]|uniref:Uncharacterized protein n=1 Tax=Sphingobacterium deserti TaxID=1229276 RepID=A0A0B8T034_9SPHI|nr:hypothetical protein [Sphingobacterium deserti]KGE13476.1 hypothetical protein DI53_2761 [Sphingobacterium deserti]